MAEEPMWLQPATKRARQRGGGRGEPAQKEEEPEEVEEGLRRRFREGTCGAQGSEAHPRSKGPGFPGKEVRPEWDG
eukprot:2621701-Heterocapsa_arctica.AAC.1